MNKHFVNLFIILGVVSGGFASREAGAIDGLYLGVQGGYVGLTDGGTSGLGAGVDVGFAASPVVDLVFRSQFSKHDPTSFTLWSNTMSADFHLGNFYDVDISLGGGPGLYKFNVGARFGLHGELNTDVAFGEGFRAGLGWRYHGILGGRGSGEGSYWSVMARFGYLFTI